MKTCLNFGAGVNSTALIAELVRRNEKPDYVVFADTGCEMPETYEHIVRMDEWFKKNGINFVTVKSTYGNLYDYYFNRKRIPFRKFRDCTDKFKMRPMTKYAKQFKEEGLVELIGIAADEKKRVRVSKTKWITFKYPLVEWGWNRDDCVKAIERAGIPVPPKSGCFMCPFQSRKSWAVLIKSHPDLYDRADLLERNNPTYPTNTLIWDGTLEGLRKTAGSEPDSTCFKDAMERKLDCPAGTCMI